MKRDLPDFKTQTANEHARLGAEGAMRLLDAGRAWKDVLAEPFFRTKTHFTPS